MVKECFQSLRCFLLLTLLTGVMYPLLITVVGQLVWPEKARGSLVSRDQTIVGSELIAQKFASDRYFHSRPSAGDYVAVPSGASNLAPTSAALKEGVQARVKIYGEQAPFDLLTTSGSGLDPHLSPEAVLNQLDRVANKRGLTGPSVDQLRALVVSLVEPPTFGFMGKSRVNILKLNLAIDRSFP